MHKTQASDHPSPAQPTLWVDRPWIDLLVGCGGWSIPLLLISYVLGDQDGQRWSAVFYGLAIVFNYPHYMATIYRAYGRADRQQYRLFTHYATALLVLAAVAAHVWFGLLPWLFTAYVMWSPWHYSGQNFGLVMMFLRRAGIDVSARERQRVRIAFVASYVMLLAAFNDGPSRDPLVLSLGLPSVAARAIEVCGILLFLGAGILTFVPIARRAGARALVAPLTLYSTQALWFVVPIALTFVAPLPVPQTRYSSGVLAIMHSAQYLWITQYFARREAERGPAPWNGLAYAGTLVVGGLALFLPIPWLASYGWHHDFTASMLIVTAVVNIHHFVLDGVVWKLRNPRVKEILVATGTAAPRTSSVTQALRPWGRRIVSRSGLALLTAALLALAALDQRRYQLAGGNTDRPSLEAAAALNPYDSGTFLRLAQAASLTGDRAAAEQALRRAIAANPQSLAPAQALERLLIESNRSSEAYAQCLAILDRWPGDVDTLVNAGVLAFRMGEHQAAERWWQRALDEDRSLMRVHLYLAELLDARDDTTRALVHYRAYLELVAIHGRDGLDPREVVSVVLKFADALAHQGHGDLAVVQYDLAIRMAGQNKLTDLEAVAQERRAALGR